MQQSPHWSPCMRIAAILVAAGSGLRFGAERPKQFSLLAGKPGVRWAAELLAAEVDLLQPVGDSGLLGPVLEGVVHLPIVGGGAAWQGSVGAGCGGVGA